MVSVRCLAIDDSILSELLFDISTRDRRSETEFRREEDRVSVVLLRLIKIVSSCSSARRPGAFSERLRACDGFVTES
jgi:hypothetical protein